MNRRELVEALEILLSDEFDSSELVYETDNELMERIVQVAYYYMDKYNEFNNETED
jgi:hypothetical protein